RGMQAETKRPPHGRWIGNGSGIWCVAIDAGGTGAEYCEHFAGMMGQFNRTGKGELLIAAAGAGGAIQRDGHLAAGDEAEAAMQSTQIVEAIEQIAGGFGIVPVVA